MVTYDVVPQANSVEQLHEVVVAIVDASPDKIADQLEVSTQTVSHYIELAEWLGFLATDLQTELGTSFAENPDRTFAQAFEERPLVRHIRRTADETEQPFSDAAVDVLAAHTNLSDATVRQRASALNRLAEQSDDAEQSDEAGDPERVLNGLILEMKEQIMEAKKWTAVAIADEQRAKRKLEDALRRLTAGERTEKELVEEQPEDAARDQVELEQTAAECRAEWERQKQRADEARQSLREFNNKIEEAKRRKNVLVDRDRAVEAAKFVQNSIQRVGVVSEALHDLARPALPANDDGIEADDEEPHDTDVPDCESE